MWCSADAGAFGRVSTPSCAGCWISTVENHLPRRSVYTTITKALPTAADRAA